MDWPTDFFQQEYLTKILMTKAHALCHDINQITKSSSHIDIVFGFSTGDIIWYEPISQKYSRINKNVSPLFSVGSSSRLIRTQGIINPTAVYAISWMPGSENLFLAAHEDGSLVVYDKEKEDAVFVPEEAADRPLSGDPQHPNLQIRKSVQSKNQKTNPVSIWKVLNQRINAFAFSPDGRHLAVASEDGSLRIIDYHKEA